MTQATRPHDLQPCDLLSPAQNLPKPGNEQRPAGEVAEVLLCWVRDEFREMWKGVGAFIRLRFRRGRQGQGMIIGVLVDWATRLMEGLLRGERNTGLRD